MYRVYTACISLAAQPAAPSSLLHVSNERRQVAERRDEQLQLSRADLLHLSGHVLSIDLAGRLLEEHGQSARYRDTAPSELNNICTPASPWAEAFSRGATPRLLQRLASFTLTNATGSFL